MERWIVGIGGNEMDGVSFRRVEGTEAQVKSYIARLVRSFKAEDPEDFDYGTTRVKDICAGYNNPNSLYGYAAFSSYHIDIEACLEDEIDVTPAAIKKGAES